LPEIIWYVSEWPAISLCGVTTVRLVRNDKHITAFVGNFSYWQSPVTMECWVFVEWPSYNKCPTCLPCMLLSHNR